MNIGLRLKSVRRSKGFSQRELASRAGVTNGLVRFCSISEISPSIASLKRILDAIPMSFSEFFSVESASRRKIFYAADELTEINLLNVLRLTPDAKGLSLRQVGDARLHQLQMLHERYAPGADTGEALYAHEGEEAGVVIAGAIELTVGDRSRILRRGDAYIFDSRIPHRFRNPGDEDCEIVSACTPPTF